jgi:hypothetical protein
MQVRDSKMTEKNFWNEKYMTMEKDEVERIQIEKF